MRKSWTLLLFLVGALLVLPAGLPATASGSVTRVGSRLVSVLEPRETVHETIVSGGLAFTGSLERMAIYNVSKPGKPKLLGWATGWAEAMAKSGGLLYVRLGDGYVAVLDVTDPASISVVGWIYPPPVDSAPPSPVPLRLSFEGPIAVRNGVLYAVCQDYRDPFTMYRALCLTDVSDPTSPVPLGQAALRGWPTHLLVRRGFAYVGSATHLETVKVANPSNPVLTRRIQSSTAGLGVDRNRLYAGVGTNTGRIKVFSLARPGRPRLLGSLWARSYLWEADDLAVIRRGRRSYLFAAWNTTPESFVYVDVYDVTSPLRRLGRKSLLLIKGRLRGLPNSSINEVTVSGNHAYVSQWYAGVRVIRVDF